MELKENWLDKAPPILPEEEGMNPPHLQRLRYNPEYCKVDESKVKIGDEIVIGFYASTTKGNPSIRWREVKVEGLPLRDFYSPFVEARIKCKT